MHETPITLDLDRLRIVVQLAKRMAKLDAQLVEQITGSLPDDMATLFAIANIEDKLNEAVLAQ